MHLSYPRLLVASQNGYMYVYSIPLDGGESQLIKKHGRLKKNISEMSNTLSYSVDLKNIDQPSSQAQQQATLFTTQESMPINVPNRSSSTPKSSADD